MMAGGFTVFGATLADIRAAYQDRLAEANELLLAGNGRHGTAMALAIYAVEIYLKVRICERLDLDALPRAFQIHDLESLLVLSGLKRRMDALGKHPVESNWDDLISPPLRLLHINDLRYRPNSIWTEADAVEVLTKIQDPVHGVLPWLSAQP
jgi:hypothetical protein